VALTVLDAGVLIAVLDAGDALHAAAVRVLSDVRGRGDDLVIPVSAYAESLVWPSRRGSEAIAVVDRFIDALPARIEPASRSIAAAAAVLRAEHGPSLRLPDALVVATAAVLEADRVITTDTRWPSMAVPVEVIRAT
jgi:predicted nucleic acid-binding protein